ncbi:hypothetical protein [Corynebacterium sp. AOP12-C2-36]|uniref:hypothetical protein n=1 Tax=Corynebacterium sp. AOP12-C2-36 TaxID=3457723 RepID=UPI004034B1F5
MNTTLVAAGPILLGIPVTGAPLLLILVTFVAVGMFYLTRTPAAAQDAAAGSRASDPRLVIDDLDVPFVDAAVGQPYRSVGVLPDAVARSAA